MQQVQSSSQLHNIIMVLCLSSPCAVTGGSMGGINEDMMLVGRLGDSLFAMPAPHGHGSTGIAEAKVVDYPMAIDGRLGDEVPYILPIAALSVLGSQIHRYITIQDMKQRIEGSLQEDLAAVMLLSDSMLHLQDGLESRCLQ